jgi:hypothetical protein
MRAAAESWWRRAYAAAAPLRARPGLVCALAVVALSAFTYEQFFRSGVMQTGDTGHAARIYEMDRCLNDGQIPCRWAADLGNGYGQPLFNYYSPLPYYVGALLHKAGFSYLKSADALFIIAFVGAALSMFLLARRLWGNLGGAVSAMVFVYAPYLGFNGYLRGALVELWGLAVTPLLLWAIHELVTTGRRRFVPLVALSTALLLLSHNLVAMIVFPAAVALTLALLPLRGRQASRPALLCGAGAVWGFGLAAFFELPVLLEADLVQLENLIEPPYHFAGNFFTSNELFLVRSADYRFIVAGERGAPVQIGWAQWALAGLSAPATAVFWRTQRRREALAVAVFAGAFAFASFMSLSQSTRIWNTFDSLHYLQFPWRYTGLVSLSAGLLAGAWFGVLRSRPIGVQLLAAAVVIGVTIGLGQPFFQPILRCTDAISRELHCPPDDEAYFSDEFFPVQQFGGIEAYLPSAVDEVPNGLPDAAAAVLEGAASISAGERSSDSLSFAVDADGAARIEAALTDFPNWRVRIDGETAEHTASAPHGLVAFSVPSGAHEVDIQLESTNVRRLGNIISLLSWLALLLAGASFVAAPLLKRMGVDLSRVMRRQRP